MTTIGVIGLGRMGGNMARRLIDEGYGVVGCDVSETAVGAAVEYGADAAASPGEVAGAADVAITSLPGPEAVESVYRDDGGVLDGGGEGLVALEASTIDPDTTERIAAAASDTGVRVVDAPVSGGPEASREGTLSVMVGAADGDVGADVEGVLDALAKDVYYLGGVGAGHTAKLLNNMMSMGNTMLAMEAMALGSARGVDGAAIFEVISNSGGSSNQFEKRMPRVLNRNFEPGFTVDFAKKDLGLALKTAESTNYPAVAASVIHELYTEASAAGLGDEDTGAVVKLFERYTDEPVESDEEMDESYGGY